MISVLRRPLIVGNWRIISLGVRNASSWLTDAERWRTSFTDLGECADVAPTPIEVVSKSGFKEWYSAQPSSTQQWLEATGKAGLGPKAHSHFFLPSASESSSGDRGAAHGVVRVVFIANDTVALDGDDGGLHSPFAFSSLPAELPPGRYLFSPPLPQEVEQSASLSWALGAYSFQRYKTAAAGGGSGGGGAQLRTTSTAAAAASTRAAAADRAQLVLRPSRQLPSASSPASLSAYVDAAATATYLVRDLVNTPAEDCGPAVIQAVAEEIAEDIKARASSSNSSLGVGETVSLRTLVGDELLAEDWPMVHAVGRAAAVGREPRVVDLTWSPPQTLSPQASPVSVTLVGKGVTFDTGGLNLKPGDSMLTMKKDMGGAAQVLGLTLMLTRILGQQQSYSSSSADAAAAAAAAGEVFGFGPSSIAHLRVLIPVAENSVGPSSFRPGDVLAGRHGLLTTEV